MPTCTGGWSCQSQVPQLPVASGLGNLTSLVRTIYNLPVSSSATCCSGDEFASNCSGPLSLWVVHSVSEQFTRQACFSQFWMKCTSNGGKLCNSPRFHSIGLTQHNIKSTALSYFTVPQPTNGGNLCNPSQLWEGDISLLNITSNPPPCL